MTKPFQPRELIARTKALLRRVERTQEDQPRLMYGSLAMDVTKHEVRSGAGEVILTAKEFGLLERFYVTRDESSRVMPYSMRCGGTIIMETQEPWMFISVA